MLLEPHEGHAPTTNDTGGLLYWRNCRPRLALGVSIKPYVQVFDDWKAHVARERETGAEDGALPRLSAVTLAFLEACCRGSPAHEWRVGPLPLSCYGSPFRTPMCQIGHV